MVEKNANNRHHQPIKVSHSFLQKIPHIRKLCVPIFVACVIYFSCWYSCFSTLETLCACAYVRKFKSNCVDIIELKPNEIRILYKHLIDTHIVLASKEFNCVFICLSRSKCSSRINKWRKLRIVHAKRLQTTFESSTVMHIQ